MPLVYWANSKRFTLLFLNCVVMTSLLLFPHKIPYLNMTALTLFSLSALHALHNRKLYLWLLLPLLLSNYLFNLLHLDESLELIKALLLLGVFSALTGGLFVHMVRFRPVSADLLFGLIAVYLMIAMGFAMGHAIVQALDQDAYLISSQPDTLPHLHDMMYFSLVTLTTVGYGDLLPMTPWARLLASAEGVIGVMFIALGVARGINMLSEPNPPGHGMP
ncbi:potassium channel family protein [Atopomonas sediminilitoris]|uniref:potassium channel family protein n=1 Tax=Atopomonas sediminilitoris TaxID=2919919 RepID=UPI001F4ECD0F|nr:potassium channel family protein [Atopomonas sediminilitoris]MCJ8168614.1 potassium channel family protein [Atopomonas sediminilitoris]